MGDELALLFKLRGDNADLKAKFTDTQAATSTLAKAFGSDMAIMQSAGVSALSEIGQHLNIFVGERLPLVGGAFIRVTENLKGIGQGALQTSPALKVLNSSIEDLATRSGKSTSEITNFLQSLRTMEGQTARNSAAIQFFGGKMDAFSGEVTTKFAPQLEQISGELATAATATEGVGAAFGEIAIPVAIALAAVGAIVAVFYELEKSIVESAIGFAEFGGQLERASQKTKLTVEQLAGLKLVAEENKVGFDTLVTGIGRYLRNLDLAANGNKALVDEFKKLGIDVQTAAKNPEEAIKQIFAAFDRLGPSIQENEVAIKLFSRAGLELIPVFRQIHGDLGTATALAKEFGVSMSEEDARGAEELEKSLVLLSAQFSGIKLAIGKEAAPALLDLVHAFGDVLRAAQPLFQAIGVVGVIAMREFVDVTRGASVLLRVATGDFTAAGIALKSYDDELERHNTLGAEAGSAARPGFTPTPTPSLQEGLQGNLDVIKEVDAEQKRAADNEIARLENLFKLGQITRAQEVADITRQNLAKFQSTRDELSAELNLKTAQIEELNKSDADYVKKKEALQAEIGGILQKQNDIEAEINRNADKARADQQVAERKATLDHQKALSDIAIQGLATRRRAIEFDVQQGTKSAEAGEALIENIDRRMYEVRSAQLQKALAAAGVEPAARQKINDEINALEARRTETEETWREKRIEIAEKEAERKRGILFAEVDTDVQIATIRTNATIASIQALAAIGIKSYERAAEETLIARSKLLDVEVNAINAKLAAAEKIVDPKRRETEQAALNNQMRVLIAQGVAISAEGDREIEAGRQDDLQKQLEYDRTVLKNEKDLNQQRRDLSKAIIEVMQAENASRVQIIARQKEAALADLLAQKKYDDEKLREEKEAAKKAVIGTDDELQKRKQLEDLFNQRSLISDAEYEKRRIAIIKNAAKAADNPIANLTDAFMHLGHAMSDSLGLAGSVGDALGSLADGAVNALAGAVGSLVQNFVLMGTTGPNAMRKLVASVLAGVAAQAAVQAVMFTAYGLAALTPWGAAIYGPATQWFEAAALMAGIALTTGLVGRKVAGDAFQQAGSSSGSGGGGGSSPHSNTATNQGPTIIQNRNTEVVHTIVVHFDPTPDATVRHVTQNVSTNGQLVKVIQGAASRGNG